MTTVVKNENPITIPRAMQRRARLAPGDRVEIRATPGVITIVAELPSADDEYTPAQRRYIDARLREAARGPYYGPFKNGAEVAAFLKKWQAAAKPAKVKTPR